MGHGPFYFFGWLTPGLIPVDKKFAPHLDSPPEFVDRMLKEGEDPKPELLDYCKPKCEYWKAKLERCEAKLEKIIKINPTKTCMYPMRDYVTCVEACAQPIIHNKLVGTD